MEPHGRSLEYLMESLGSILKVPHGIFFWQTLGRILGQTLGQKPSGLWPLGFLAEGLASDAASGTKSTKSTKSTKFPQWVICACKPPSTWRKCLLICWPYFVIYYLYLTKLLQNCLQVKGRTACRLETWLPAGLLRLDIAKTHFLTVKKCLRAGKVPWSKVCGLSGAMDTWEFGSELSIYNLGCWTTIRLPRTYNRY